MKAIAWTAGVLVILVAAFYIFNWFIYQQKQGDTSMQDTPPTVHPVSHASLVLRWGDRTIYADPVGSPELYSAFPKPDIILITHEHGDHFSTSTLSALATDDTVLVAPESVAVQLPESLAGQTNIMKNGDMESIGGLSIQAIPAYNLRPDALQFHPKGRDNGYVLEGGGVRVYIAGDTEDTPEMRALQDIDIAFLPMNLPYTMTVEQAASATLAFKPGQVYPYHYRGQDGLSDIAAFTSLVNEGNPEIEVMSGGWYSEEN